MAQGFSAEYSKRILSAVFGSNVGSVAPGTVYVALLTALPNDTDITPANEGTFSGYARYAIPNNTTQFPLNANPKVNAGSYYFGSCTGNAGTFTAFALCDALTAGTMICWGSLVTNKIVSTGDVAQIAANDISITLD
jgi:hypothetical protein